MTLQAVHFNLPSLNGALNKKWHPTLLRAFILSNAHFDMIFTVRLNAEVFYSFLCGPILPFFSVLLMLDFTVELRAPTCQNTIKII